MKQQIDIKFGGKKRKFVFGVLLIGELLERNEFEDYSDLIIKTAKNPFKYAPVIMFESLKSAYDMISKEYDFTEKDVKKWANDDYFNNESKSIVSFVETFLGTNENKAQNEDVNDNENLPKKK